MDPCHVGRCYQSQLALGLFVAFFTSNGINELTELLLPSLAVRSVCTQFFLWHTP